MLMYLHVFISYLNILHFMAHNEALLQFYGRLIGNWEVKTTTRERRFLFDYQKSMLSLFSIQALLI